MFLPLGDWQIPLNGSLTDTTPLLLSSGGKKNKKKQRSVHPDVPEVLHGELSLTTSSIKSTVKVIFFFQVWWRHASESSDVTYYGHLHLALLTSSLLLLLLFCETIHWGEGCHVKTVFRGFDAKGKWKLQRKQTARVPVCVHEWPKQYWLPVDKLMIS